MNVLTVSGNIGRDTETRQAGGSTVASFSLAMKSGYGDKAQTIWLDCSLWGKQAESGLVQYLKKGQFVVATGEMGTREHEGKTYITLRVNGVTLGGKQEAQQQAQQPSPAQHRQQQKAPQQPARQAPPAGYQGQMPQQNQQAYQDFEDDIPFAPIALHCQRLLHCM
jgi:single-strand DNA-binding protein